MSSEQPTQDIAVNRQARHEYDIEETIEAGLVLTGTEIKSVRARRVNLRGAYAQVQNGEAWIFDMHISPYEQSGTLFNHEPTRPRKLLMHRKEIERLRGKVAMKGLALVPLRIYMRGRRAKLELALARGKKLYDKRQDIAERDAKRQVQRAVRERERW
jgi:SsrA-binding protein